MAVYDFLSKVLPAYATPIKRGKVDITEREASATIKCVTWINSDFYHFNHQLSKDLKEFFDKFAHSPEIFWKDCDGIILFEHDGKKYMFLTELKSGFDTGGIYKAKRQIISSFLKTNALLHMSSCYRLEEYIIKGFIISHPPKKDFLVPLKDASRLPDNKINEDFKFAIKLLLDDKKHKLTDAEHRTIMSPIDCSCLKGLPLGERGIFKKIKFIHISVPEGSIILDVNKYL